MEKASKIWVFPLAPATDRAGLRTRIRCSFHLDPGPAGWTIAATMVENEPDQQPILPCPRSVRNQFRSSILPFWCGPNPGSLEVPLCLPFRSWLAWLRRHLYLNTEERKVL